jgi:hypothetical protein
MMGEHWLAAGTHESCIPIPAASRPTVGDHSPLPIFWRRSARDQSQMSASSGSGISGAFRVGTIVIAAILVHVGVRDVGFFEPKGSDE